MGRKSSKAAHGRSDASSEQHGPRIVASAAAAVEDFVRTRFGEAACLGADEIVAVMEIGMAIAAGMRFIDAYRCDAAGCAWRIVDAIDRYREDGVNVDAFVRDGAVLLRIGHCRGAEHTAIAVTYAFMTTGRTTKQRVV